MKYICQNNRDAASAPEAQQCNTCHRVFCSTLQLKYHVRRIHSDRTPYVCGGCRKPFRRIHELQRHSRQTLACAGSSCRSSARPDTHCCLLCGVGFRTQATLRRHLAGRSHVNDIRYTCDVCSAGFLVVDELNLHKVTVHDEWPSAFASAAMRRHRRMRHTRAAGCRELQERCAEEAEAAARAHFSVAGAAGLKLVIKKVAPNAAASVAGKAASFGGGSDRNPHHPVESAEASDSEYEPASHTTVDSGKGLSDFDDDGGGGAATPSAQALQAADDQPACSPTAAPITASSKPPLRLSIVIGREHSSAAVVVSSKSSSGEASTPGAGLIKKPRLQLASGQAGGFGSGASGKSASAQLPPIGGGAAGASSGGSALHTFASPSSLLRAPTLVSSAGATGPPVPQQPAFALSHRPHAPAFSFSRPHESFGIKAPSLLPPLPGVGLARQQELFASPTPSLASAAGGGVGAQRMQPSEILGRMAGSSLLSQRLGTGNAAAMLAGLPPTAAAAIAASSRSTQLSQLVVAPQQPLLTPASEPATNVQLASTYASSCGASTVATSSGATSAMGCTSSPGAIAGVAGRTLPPPSPSYWPSCGVPASPMHVSTGGFVSPSMHRLSASPFFPSQQYISDVAGVLPGSPAAAAAALPFYNPAMPSPALSTGHFGRPAPSFGQSLPYAATAGVYYGPMAAAQSFGHWPTPLDGSFSPAAVSAFRQQQQQDVPAAQERWAAECGGAWLPGPPQSTRINADVRVDTTTSCSPRGRSSAATSASDTVVSSSSPSAPQSSIVAVRRRARSGSQGSLDSRDSGLDYSPVGDLGAQPDRSATIDVPLDPPARGGDHGARRAPSTSESSAVFATAAPPAGNLVECQAATDDDSTVASSVAVAASTVISECKLQEVDSLPPESVSTCSHGQQLLTTGDDIASSTHGHQCGPGLAAELSLAVTAPLAPAAECTRRLPPDQVQLDLRCLSDVGSPPTLCVSIPLALLRSDMSCSRSAHPAGCKVEAVERATDGESIHDATRHAAQGHRQTSASRSEDATLPPSVPSLNDTSRVCGDERFQPEHASQCPSGGCCDGSLLLPPSGCLLAGEEDGEGQQEFGDLDPEWLFAVERGHECTRTSCDVFERCRYVEDVHYLAHLRSKTCATLLALFPDISIGGSFSPSSGDVEDLVEAVAEWVQQQREEPLTPLPQPLPNVNDGGLAPVTADRKSSAASPGKSSQLMPPPAIASPVKQRDRSLLVACSAEARSDIQRLQRGVCSLVQLLLPHLSWDVLREDGVSTFDRLLDVVAGAN